MLCLIFWISAPTTASPKPFRTSRQHVAEALRAALTPRLIHTEGHVLSALLAAANAPKFSWIYHGFDHENHGLESIGARNVAGVLGTLTGNHGCFTEYRDIYPFISFKHHDLDCVPLSWMIYLLYPYHGDFHSYPLGNPTLSSTIFPAWNLHF